MEEQLQIFKEYTNSYIDDNPYYKYKVDHTYRVVYFCEKIAKSLKLSDKDIETAMLCGLLHDISRFEQFKRYGTDRDRETIDHGDFGEELLKDGLLRKFQIDEKLDHIILIATKYHNKIKIPEGLTTEEDLFVKIIRDADKLDILNMSSKKDKVVSIDIKDDIISEDVYRDIMNNQRLDLMDMKTEADRSCIRYAFIYDMNFKETFKILQKEDYINKLIEGYLNQELNEKVTMQILNIKEHVNNYIKEKVKEC